MGIFTNWEQRPPRKEIIKDTPQPGGIVLFFSVIWREFWEICKLNILILIGCLPLITIPIVFTAAAKVLVLMLMDEPLATFSDFFQTVKKEWKRATLAGIVYFPLLATAVFSLYFYLFIINNFWLQALAMLFLAVILMIGLYLFPLLAMVDIDIKSCFRNALLLTVLRIPHNVLAFLLMFFLTAAVILFLPPSITIILLFYLGLMAYIAVFCAYGGMKRFVFKGNDDEEGDSTDL